jgi:hypothetical protein
MSRLSFDTNVIHSLSKKVDEINASNNNVTEAIKALNENTFKMSQTLQNTYHILFVWCLKMVYQMFPEHIGPISV